MIKRFVVCVLMCCVALPVWAAKGMVEITSEPLGAKVFVDGQRKGSTPQQQGKPLLLELEEGEYKLEAKTDSGAIAVFDLYVASGAIQPVHLKLLFKEPEMVLIPAGTFQMGSDDDATAKPVHTVSVKSFYMGKYEVTFEEYDKFCNATGRSKPDDEGWGRGKRPVINVSWYDAKAYVKWLSEQTGKEYRLPTEAQWEYACRAGTTTKYWWGNEIGKNNANCDGCGSQWDNKQTAPVGSFKPNPFGLYDVSGNVWEWLEDKWQTNYDGAPSDGSARMSGDSNLHLLRGGSWDYHDNSLLCAERPWSGSTDGSYGRGLRLSKVNF